MKKYILFVVLICLLLISSCKEKHECNFMYKGIENATCVEDGTISYYCECGLEKYEKIPAEGHNMVDATCQSPKKCTKCNYKEGTTVSCKFINEKCIYCNSVLPKSIYCPFTKYDVEVGETLEIIYEVQPTNAVNKQVKITSSDSSILKVENNDTLIAVSEGKVIVTIKTSNNISVECEVTVLPKKYDVTFYVDSKKLIKLSVEDYIDLNSNYKINYVYEWYSDENLTTKVDLSAKVTSDMTLYGKENSNDSIFKKYISDNGSLLLFTSSNVDYYLKVNDNNSLYIEGELQATMYDIGISFFANLCYGGTIGITGKPAIYDAYLYGLSSTTVVYSFSNVDLNYFTYNATYYNYTGDSAYVSSLKNLVSSILRTSFLEMDLFIEDLKK